MTAATQAVLRAAQQRLDDLAEPEVDDDWLTPEQAEASARDQIAATPYNWVEWLDGQCFAAIDAHSPYELDIAQRDGDRELSNAELLTLVMCGNNDAALRARSTLRERFDAAHAEQAEQDAAAMLREQELQAARMAQDHYEDHHEEYMQ